MLATHTDVERRYGALRKMALEAAQEGASASLKFCTVTADALSAATSWSKSSSRRVDWDWAEHYSAFKFRYPKRFELAIWYQNALISLSLGRPTYQGTALRLDFIEARPRNLGERPAVFDEVLIAYGIYARLIAAKQIRIMHPINDEVRAYYETFGYRYVAQHDYLYREVL